MLPPPPLALYNYVWENNITTVQQYLQQQCVCELNFIFIYHCIVFFIAEETCGVCNVWTVQLCLSLVPGGPKIVSYSSYETMCLLPLETTTFIYTGIN